VVTKFNYIANFKASRDNMWIQVHRDPGKEWLQLRYCITEEDVEMDMRDWPDDWKIPVLNQEQPKGMEVDAGQTKIPARDKATPKRPKPTQKLAQQNKWGATKKDAQTRNKETASQQKEQGAGAMGTQ
jgi:hypothetical protein